MNVPSMTLGQSIDLASLLNRKSPRPITTLQILEAVDGNAARSGSKLQESRFLFRIPRSDDLPEVLDDLVLFLVSAIIGVFLPIIHIDIGDTTNQKFKFTLVENIDQISRNKFVEAGDESVELLLNTSLDLPLCKESA